MDRKIVARLCDAVQHSAKQHCDTFNLRVISASYTKIGAMYSLYIVTF